MRGTATTPVWSTGPETKTEVDAASRVTQVQTNNGETNVTYGYDNANRKKDEWQRVAGFTHHLGLEYDVDGRRFRMHTDLHNVGYRYNQRGDLVGLGDASGATVFEWMNFDRDLNGNVNKRHTWTGSDQTFAYDDLNRVTMIESGFPAGSFARSWYQYDNVGREAQTWRDEQGSRGEQFQYTVSNQLQSAVYNALGIWNGGTPSGWSARTDYSYTPDKLNRAGTNPSGVNQATLAGGQGMAYDGNFNLTAFNAWGGWTYSYDAQNQLKSAGNNTVQCIYDGKARRGRAVHMCKMVGHCPIAPLARTTENWYDFANNKTDVQFPDGSWNKWRQFDGFGQAWQYFDERNNVTDLAYQWGPMKKLDTVTTPRVRDGGGTENEVTNYDYDGVGKPTRTTFPDGTFELTTYVSGLVDAFRNRKTQTKRHHYDAREREDYHTWDGEAAPRIDRVWDDASRLTKIWNKFSTVEYSYDDAGQVRTEGNTVAGSGGLAQLVYKRYASGEPAHVTYPRGWIIRRDYTARGQLKTVGWDDANGNWTQKAIDYTYLNDGKVDHQDYGNGTRSSFGYDGRGLIANVRHRRIAPDQSYSYRDYWRDSRDRIYAWKRSGASGYNARENGRGERYEYDGEGQLTRAYYEAPDPPGSGNGYQSDDNFSGLDTAGAWRGYDALGNRQGNNVQAGRGWMWYNRRDNGLNQYLNWGGAAATYDTQYYSTPGNGVLMQEGWITASYNALNQPIAISSPSLPAGQFTWFGYDPLGRCVKRWVSATGAQASNPATYYYYDGWNLVQEGPSASNGDWIYFHGGRVDEVIASHQFSTNLWNYYHYDARGHVSLLTNETGALVEQYEYRAFGEPLFFGPLGGSLAATKRGNRFLFTGREWLAELKLYDYRNRMYQPAMGRFLQPDPVGLQIEGAKLSDRAASFYAKGEAPKTFSASEFNLYRYCHNDPINKSDPMGLITLVFPGFGGQNGSNQRFIEAMKEKFKDAVVFSRSQAGQAKAVEAVKQAIKNGDKTVNIAGYSRGGIGAIQAAGKLGKEGISVNRLVTVDPVTVTGNNGSIGVPSNVQRADNFYQGGARRGLVDFPGTPLRAGPNIQNNFVPDSAAGLLGRPVVHQNMPSIYSILDSE